MKEEQHVLTRVDGWAIEYDRDSMPEVVQRDMECLQGTNICVATSFGTKMSTVALLGKAFFVDEVAAQQELLERLLAIRFALATKSALVTEEIDATKRRLVELKKGEQNALGL